MPLLEGQGSRRTMSRSSHTVSCFGDFVCAASITFSSMETRVCGSVALRATRSITRTCSASKSPRWNASQTVGVSEAFSPANRDLDSGAQPTPAKPIRFDPSNRPPARPYRRSSDWPRLWQLWLPLVGDALTFGDPGQLVGVSAYDDDR
jgi:hypothetical protein